jgi:hypothetical protein
MGASVSDEFSRRLEKVKDERKREEREAKREIDKALNDAERRQWSQKKYGHERGR